MAAGLAWDGEGGRPEQRPGLREPVGEGGFEVQSPERLSCGGEAFGERPGWGAALKWESGLGGGAPCGGEWSAGSVRRCPVLESGLGRKMLCDGERLARGDTPRGREP